MNIRQFNTFYIAVLFAYFSPVTATAENVTSDTTIKIVTSEIRQYTVDDSIHYSTSITGSGIAISGEISHSIGKTVTTPTGLNCLEHTITSTYDGVDEIKPLNIRLLYFQDKNNSLYECGHYDNAKTNYVFITDTSNTPKGLALLYKSPMKLGNSTSNLITYSDGTWKDCTHLVNAIEEVETPIGKYESYKISESCITNTNNSRTTSSIWFVPNLFTIKESGEGNLFSGEFILNSYSLK